VSLHLAADFEGFLSAWAARLSLFDRGVAPWSYGAGCEAERGACRLRQALV